MLTEWLRRIFHRTLSVIGQILSRLGFLSPNLLTALGFLLSMGVGVLLAFGYLRWGGGLTVLAGACDGLDGALARAENRRSRFGAFFDSTLDRFSESAILLGLLIYYLNRGALLEPILIYTAIVGSLLVSYTRARAESLSIECKVGILTRLERFLVLVGGLLLNQVQLALWVLALGSHLTALQRIYHVWKQTRSEEGLKK